MTHLHRVWIGLVVVSASSAIAPAAEDIDVAVVNQVTFLGEQQAPVDPVLNPIRYQFITRGHINFGRALPGEQEPDEAALLQHIAAVLRPMGYLPADGVHPPRVAFTVLWGSAVDLGSHALEFVNTSRLPIKWEPLPPNAMRKNVRLRDNWPDLKGDTVRRIMRLSYKDPYLFAIAACDWQNAFTGREVFLWQVRAIAASERMPAETAFHRMIDAITPHLGRAADEPHIVVSRAEREALSLRLGFAEGTELPAPIDLTAVIAHDFETTRFRR